MNNKGFSYVEMVCALAIIVVLVCVTIHLFHPKFIYAKETSFINQANTIVKAAINKYTNDSNEADNSYPDDIYKHINDYDGNFGKVCYNIKSLKGMYLDKLDSSYQGSIEICTLTTCEHKTKIWLSNDKYYLNGAPDEISKKNLSNNVLGINRCGNIY